MYRITTVDDNTVTITNGGYTVITEKFADIPDGKVTDPDMVSIIDSIFTTVKLREQKKILKNKISDIDMILEQNTSNMIKHKMPFIVLSSAKRV